MGVRGVRPSTKLMDPEIEAAASGQEEGFLEHRPLLYSTASSLKTSLTGKFPLNDILIPY